MAEVFGLVASGLAIAEIIGRVGAGILNLKRLYEDLGNVPRSIQNLLRRLDIVFVMLEQVPRDTNFCEHSMDNGLAVQSCIRYCESAFTEMAASIENILVGMDSTKSFKRRRARIKVIWNSSLIASHEQQLSDIIQLLTLAEATSSRAQIKSLATIYGQRTTELESNTMNQPNQVHKETAQINCNTVIGNPQQILLGTMRGVVPTLAWRGPAFFGNFMSTRHIIQITEGSSEYSVTEREIRLQFPYWLTQKAWEMRISSGWKYTLRSYNLVPSTSPSFRYAAAGDMQEMLELFQNGKASPFDTNEAGASLLDMSLLFNRPNVAKALIRIGCEFHWASALMGYTNMVFNGNASEAKDDMALFHDYDTVVTSEGLWDFLQEKESTFILRALSAASRLNKLVLETLVPRVLPNHNTMPISDRLSLLVKSHAIYSWPHPEAFCFLLWPDGVVSASDIQELQSSGYSFLHMVAYYSAGSGLLDDRYQYIRTLEGESGRSKRWRQDLYSKGRFKSLHYGIHDAWKDVRIEVIRGSLDLHFRQNSISPPGMSSEIPTSKPLGTPMSAILSVYRGLLRTSPRRTREVPQKDHDYMINAALASWLQDLYHSNIDLKEYGQKELEILKGTQRDDYTQYCGFRCDERHWNWVDGKGEGDQARFPRLQTFEFGPLATDWVFHWDWEVEDFAGEFWETIEDSAFSIPGSWVDTDDGMGDDHGAGERPDHCALWMQPYVMRKVLTSQKL